MPEGMTSFQKEVIDRLARIEARLDGISDHEERICALEGALERGKGFSAAISVVIGLISALIGAGVVTFFR